MSEFDVILYTRRGCCLCDQAKALLEKHGLAVREVDIDADPQLRERYTECVPVVVINGRERFRGRVDERLLMRILRSEGQ
jgi:glutaredoxin